MTSSMNQVGFLALVSREWQAENFSLIFDSIKRQNDNTDFLFISMDNKYKGNSSSFLDNSPYAYLALGPELTLNFKSISLDSLAIIRYIKTLKWSFVYVLCDKNHGSDLVLASSLSVLLNGKLVLFQHGEHIDHTWCFDWVNGYTQQVSNPLKSFLDNLRRAKLITQLFLLKASLSPLRVINSFSSYLAHLSNFRSPFFAAHYFFSYSPDHFQSVKRDLPPSVTHKYVGSIIKEKILLNFSLNDCVPSTASLVRDVRIFSTGAYRSHSAIAISRQSECLSSIICALNLHGIIPSLVFKAGELETKEFISSLSGAYTIHGQGRFDSFQSTVYIVPIDSNSVIELNALGASVFYYSIFTMFSPQALRIIDEYPSSLVWTPFFTNTSSLSKRISTRTDPSFQSPRMPTALPHSPLMDVPPSQLIADNLCHDLIV